MKECAFGRDGECSVLRRKNCKGCSFRKTREELAAGREKSRRRVSTLPQETRIYIADRYVLKNFLKKNEDQ